MAETYPLLNQIITKFNDPSTQEKFKDFTKKIMFDFTDTKEQYVLSVQDGKTASLAKGGTENPEVLVTTTSDLFASIMAKTSNPVTAYMTRKIKVKGSMEDLLKLQKLMF